MSVQVLSNHTPITQSSINTQWKNFKRKKNYVGSKKVKNICLNSSVANNDRPIISKTNCLEENLNDPNCSIENKKGCSNAFHQSVQKHSLQNPKNIVIGHLNVNSLRNKFEAVKEIVLNKVEICFLWNRNRLIISK